MRRYSSSSADGFRWRHSTSRPLEPSVAEKLRQRRADGPAKETGKAHEGASGAEQPSRDQRRATLHQRPDSGDRDGDSDQGLAGFELVLVHFERIVLRLKGLGLPTRSAAGSSAA
jgi:hypothetical protein